MSKVTGFFTVFVAVLLGLHVWATLSPSHYNWGLHYFAFFPTVWAVAALLAVVLVLVPAVRSALLARLSSAARSLGSLPPLVNFLMLLAFWVAMMFLFQAKLHLLGDSELILALTPRLPSIEDVSANFRNQPLTYEALRLVQWMSGGGGLVEPMALYRIADGIAGVIYLGLIFHFLRTLPTPALDTLLVGIVLLFRVGTQFFFGYVENYMFFYVALTAYVVTGWLALEKKTPVWVPLAILATVPGFHIAGVIFLPTVLLLLLPWWTSHRKYFLGAVGAIAAAAVAGVAFLGPSWVWTRIADALANDFLPLTSAPGGVPYGIFSGAHLADWLNANAHIAPFGIACVVIGVAALPRAEYASSPVFRFLALSSAIGLCTTFVILPGLGMARDWDMLSNFFVPLRFLSIYFLMLLLRAKEARHAVLMLAVVGVVRWAGWVGINADEDKHLARAEVLTVPELSGTFPKLYYESLAKVYYERNDFVHAAKWYERYMTVDSTHPRILANLSDCYRALGQEDKLFRTLELSAAAKSTNPGVYSNLAVEYVKRGDTTRGIELLNEALKYDPEHFESHANLCLLNMEMKNYAEARRHALEAIRLGVNEPILLKDAGYASYFLSDYREAALYLGEYLRAAPADAKTKQLLDLLERALARKTEPAGRMPAVPDSQTATGARGGVRP